MYSNSMNEELKPGNVPDTKITETRVVRNNPTLDRKRRQAHFFDVIDRAKKEFSLKTDKALSNALGMSPTAFHNRKNTFNLPFLEFIKFANARNVNLNWLFDGNGPVYNNDKPDTEGHYSKSKKEEIIVVEHSDLVKEFKDKPRAIKMNQNLLRIEKKNRQAFRDVDNYLEGIANGLEYSHAANNKEIESPQSKALVPEENDTKQKKIS